MNTSSLPPFDELLTRALDQAEPDYAALTAAFEADPTRIRQYAEHAILTGWLRWDLSQTMAMPVGLDMDSTSEAVRVRPWHRSMFLRVAAAIVLMATAWMFWPHATPPTPAPYAAPQEAPAMAVLTDRSDDATFADAATSPLLGESAPAGPIRLAAGRAQFMFKSSAVVDLTGPCTFEMTGPNRGRLTSGKLEAYVRPEARGFTLDLPGEVRIVDLGTRFGVTLDSEGDAVVQVIEGRIRIVTPTQSLEPALGRVVRIVDGHLISELPDGLAESFDAATMPAMLERTGDSAIAFGHGAALFAGDDAKRAYLRTVRSDWCARSFVAEAVVQIPTNAGKGIYLGIGSGEPGEATAGATPSVMMRVMPNRGLIQSEDTLTGAPRIIKQFNGRTMLGGTHRLRLVWDADARRATFEFYREKVPEAEARYSIDVTADAFRTPDAPSRLFISAVNGVSFTRLTITPADAPKAGAPPAPAGELQR
ncbi:MAG: hypothetical protein GC162_14725 [Planctomycetes bacterium]|nr:hypothetical protein [Planctomycetota bacterium]